MLKIRTGHKVSASGINLVALLLGLGLVLLHGFSPGGFRLDWYALAALFILTIPLTANYLRAARIPGASFEFRDEIDNARRAVERSVDVSAGFDAELHTAEQPTSREKAANVDEHATRSLHGFTTFDLDQVDALVESDPVLALAALRIEIEKKLGFAVRFLGLSKIRYVPVSDSIRLLLGDYPKMPYYIVPDQAEALSRILRLCQKAVHGIPVSQAEAKQIVQLAHELEESFPVGYSINFTPVENYEDHGLMCEWEHCIEHMPLADPKTDLSCPVFGHDCPGGKSLSLTCRSITEESDSRARKDGSDN